MTDENDPSASLGSHAPASPAVTEAHPASEDVLFEIANWLDHVEWDSDSTERTAANYSEDLRVVALAVELRNRDCVWSYGDNESGAEWEGSCGAKWEFLSEGPAENKMHFCPECGGRVIGSGNQASPEHSVPTRRSEAQS